MRALTWQGKRDVRVETVPDPKIEEPTDAIVRITSTAICGSDLHLYEVLAPYLTPGDVLGHEPMGIVEEVGPGVTHLKAGDRVVVPFNISCGSCWMCSRGLYAQCETTQVREQGKGAALFGYTSLYGAVPGGQAEYLRVPQAHFGPIKVPDAHTDERFLYLSDILPTAWQAVAYADVPPRRHARRPRAGAGRARSAPGSGGTRAPSASSAVDLVPERLAMARAQGVEVLDMNEVDDVARGPARADRRPRPGRGDRRRRHGGARLAAWQGGPGGGGAAAGRAGAAADRPLRDRPAGRAARGAQGRAPRRHGVAQRRLRRRGGPDADDGDVRPGHPAADGPVPRQALDRRHPAAGARRRRPAGHRDLATHLLPLEEAPHGYEIFQKKEDGCVKVVLKP